MSFKWYADRLSEALVGLADHLPEALVVAELVDRLPEALVGLAACLPERWVRLPCPWS